VDLGGDLIFVDHVDHRAPLLIIGCGMDHVAPAWVTSEAADLAA
jgi:hypothetical protein